MVSRSEIVAALAFVWLGGAIGKAGDWTVGAVSFKAGQSDAAIRELDAPPLSDIGGTVYLRVHNESLAPLIITDATIGGQPVDTLMHARRVWWWRQLPASVVPDHCGIVEFCADFSVFPPGKRRVGIVLRDAAGASAECAART
jgi:hypothetical protein